MLFFIRLDLVMVSVHSSKTLTKTDRYQVCYLKLLCHFVVCAPRQLSALSYLLLGVGGKLVQSQ